MTFNLTVEHQICKAKMDNTEQTKVGIPALFLTDAGDGTRIWLTVLSIKLIYCTFTENSSNHITVQILLKDTGNVHKGRSNSGP